MYVASYRAVLLVAGALFSWYGSASFHPFQKVGIVLLVCGKKTTRSEKAIAEKIAGSYKLENNIISEHIILKNRN